MTSYCVRIEKTTVTFYGLWLIGVFHVCSVARFINHSSDPNLNIASVLYDHHDPRMAHICLFASHNIPPLTELTYDYGTDYQEKLLGASYEHSLSIGSR